MYVLDFRAAVLAAAECTPSVSVEGGGVGGKRRDKTGIDGSQRGHRQVIDGSPSEAWPLPAFSADADAALPPSSPAPKKSKPLAAANTTTATVLIL